MEYDDEFTDAKNRLERFRNDVDLAGSELVLLMQKAISIVKENEHQYNYEPNVSDILETAKMLLRLLEYEKENML